MGIPIFEQRCVHKQEVQYVDSLPILTPLFVTLWTPRPMQTMAKYLRVSITGRKCLCVSRNPFPWLPWPICFYVRVLVPMSSLKLQNYIYIYIYIVRPISVRPVVRPVVAVVILCPYRRPSRRRGPSPVRPSVSSVSSCDVVAVAVFCPSVYICIDS